MKIHYGTLIKEVSDITRVTQKDVKEIIGITDSRNIASARLMQSLGMVKVPDFETRLVCKGEDCIEYKYAIRIHD